MQPKIKIEKIQGTPEILAQRVPPNAKFERTVEAVEISEPMLVLGSSGDEKNYRVDKLESEFKNQIKIVKRRSGGGAVLVIPGSFIWVNILIPADDPAYELNLKKSFNYVGKQLACILNELYGLAPKGLNAHESTESFYVRSKPLQNSLEGKIWCFLDGNEGEVYFGKKKVVGISQRRNRFGSCYYVGINSADRFTEMDLITLYDRLGAKRVTAFTDKSSYSTDAKHFDFASKIKILPDLDQGKFISLLARYLTEDLYQ